LITFVIKAVYTAELNYCLSLFFANWSKIEKVMMMQ